MSCPLEQAIQDFLRSQCVPGYDHLGQFRKDLRTWLLPRFDPSCKELRKAMESLGLKFSGHIMFGARRKSSTWGARLGVN